jgi:hypothetical protein
MRMALPHDSLLPHDSAGCLTIPLGPAGLCGYNLARAIMDWKEFIHVEILKLASRHTSGSLIIILLFSGTAYVARHVIHEPSVLWYIETVDNIVVRAAITWLALVMLWELGAVLVRIVRSGGSKNPILAA